MRKTALVTSLAMSLPLWAISYGVEGEKQPEGRRLIPVDRELPNPVKRGTKPKGKPKKHNKKKKGW